MTGRRSNQLSYRAKRSRRDLTPASECTSPTRTATCRLHIRAVLDRDHYATTTTDFLGKLKQAGCNRFTVSIRLISGATPTGFEPATFAQTTHCSTAELKGHSQPLGGILLKADQTTSYTSSPNSHLVPVLYTGFTPPPAPSDVRCNQCSSVLL